MSSLVAGAAPDRATALSIFQHMRDRLAPFKRVRRLEFAELPKTISGKIRRVELRRAEDDRASAGTREAGGVPRRGFSGAAANLTIGPGPSPQPIGNVQMLPHHHARRGHA